MTTPGSSDKLVFGWSFDNVARDNPVSVTGSVPIQDVILIMAISANRKTSFIE